MARIRRLDAVEVRVLGALLEKQVTTPEQYPLTVNTLLAACNQRSNREPVTSLDEEEILAALKRLKAEALVWRTEGARTERWEHLLDRRLGLTPAVKALITLLFLRGAQTPGELRTRSERLHDFGSVAVVEATLGGLAAQDDPLTRELPRQPGQRESRWMHLLGEEDAPPLAAAPSLPAAARPPAGASLADRVSQLEETVAALQAELAALRVARD
ncbi:MAG TPA: YceH family protein [Thermoanaerobaculia bacterium]|nr:YceH family protein [Thermoanaerobaculia bacterium]